jgi:hypothetical protein
MLGYAQEETNRLSYGVETFGSVSTQHQTPFWMVSNQQGVIPLEANNGFLRTDIGYHHRFGRDFGWTTKADLIAVTPRYRNIYVQQLFTELAYKGVRLSIGSQETGRYLQTVTDPFLSSGDLGLAINARPIPEINAYSPGFLSVPWTSGWLQVKGNFSVGRSFDTDYLNSFINEKQHYIQNLLWHHKSLYLQLKDTKQHAPVSFIVGIRHAVQWGGEATDPKLKGQQPHAFMDFVRIVFGQSGDQHATLSDQINALGAHYGSYDFRLSVEKKDWTVHGYYQHIFGDASGMEFYNGLDGLKGLQIESSKFPWLRKIVFEHLYTLDQSGPFHFIGYDYSKYPGYGGGGDNYYNNQEYTTGFSYFNRSLGSPFLVSPEYNKDGQVGFKHSRVQAWYLGAEGAISRKLSYRFMVSTMESFGVPYAPTLKKLTATSFKTDFFYTHNDWTFTATIAADQGSLLGDHRGIGLSIKKRGIILRP